MEQDAKVRFILPFAVVNLKAKTSCACAAFKGLRFRHKFLALCLGGSCLDMELLVPAVLQLKGQNVSQILNVQFLPFYLKREEVAKLT